MGMPRCESRCPTRPTKTLLSPTSVGQWTGPAEKLERMEVLSFSYQLVAFMLIKRIVLLFASLRVFNCSACICLSY